LFGLTRGNPLFTIELLRGMQERGDLRQEEDGCWVVGPELDWQTLPARLEGAIGERLGRLDPQLQEILQVASVEGEEFTAEVVAQVLGLDRREVVQLLSRQLDRQHRVVRSLGIQHNGVNRISRYGFRHNLIQRYLYNSLDEVERVYQHEEVGRALAELYGDQADAIAVELALHFERAALTPETVGYLQRAAEQALRRGAYTEAMRRLERAMALLKTLPDGRVRAGLELGVQALLAPAVVTTRGMADPQAEAAYVRALQLAEQVENAPQLSSVLFGLATMREYQGLYAESQALLEQRLQLPQAGEDSALHVESRELLACSTFHQGLFGEALTHAQEGLTLYEPRAHAGLIPLHGHNLEPACHVWAAHALWFLGSAERSAAEMEAGLRAARRLGHDFSLATVLVQVAFLQQFGGDARAVRETAHEALALAEAQGYPYRAAEARILAGWAQAMLGEEAQGLALLEQGLEEVRALGGRIDLPYFLGLQAQVQAAEGRTALALQTLETALTAGDAREEQTFFYDAELSRLRASLLLALGGKANAPAAEACLSQALKVAERQEARMLALRAATDLARLWRQQGRVDEARKLLAGHYEPFEEGFDTEDLRQAATLLEELAGP
jgi:adenylate cyclase